LKFIEIWQKDFAIERSIDQNVCLDRDNNPIPWYTYPAIEYLSQLDFSNKKIFEFGVGYSSLFWATRALAVTGIEDNFEWYQKWQKSFNAPNLTLKQRHEGEAYYNAVLEDKLKYDVIIIDGKCRAECAKTAVQALNTGGFIILDDSDRVNTSIEYKSAIGTLRRHNLIQIDFFGFCPMNNYTKTTSLFLSRDFDFKSRFEVQPTNGIGNLWGMGRKKRKEFYNENK
jgi:hypothetical protein